MSAHFGAFIDIESGPKDLPAAFHKPTINAPSPLELDELAFGTRYNGPKTPVSEILPIGSIIEHSPYTGGQTPHELLAEPPSTAAAIPFVPSWSNPPMNKYRILSGCLVFFGSGMTDSAAGALIPYIQAHYNIGYAVVSLIFVTQAVGFILAAFFNDMLVARIGRARAMMLADALLILAYILILVTPPFAVVTVAYFLLGYAMAIGLAILNVFLANLAQSTVILGLCHGTYGVGGIVGPIAATGLVSAGVGWSRYFCVPLAIRAVSLVCVGYTFWDYEKETPTKFITALAATANQQVAAENGNPTKGKKLTEAFKNRVTPIGALFIFAYQGAEVSISGWVISYLIDYRAGDPTHVGYVTAGFWGGITLGRFLLTPIAQRVGEGVFVTALGLGAIAFQLLTWFVPSVIGDAVTVSIIGLLIGPIYPCAATIFTRLMPRSIHTTGLSFIAGAGSSGGAVAPFFTGLIAQAVGTYVLHPICIGLFVLMLGCWYALPKQVKRDE